MSVTVPGIHLKLRWLAAAAVRAPVALAWPGRGLGHDRAAGPGSRPADSDSDFRRGPARADAGPGPRAGDGDPV